MSELAGTLAPALLSLVSGPVPVSDRVVLVHWFVAGVPLLGLLGVGFRDVLGGGGRDDAVEEDPDDFLDGLDDEEQADEFGDFDDDLGPDDDPLEEVEPRIDDLEHDLADLSADVSAIRGEHETIRESVEEVEANVRKLLEVYEVVTRGMNPFADDPTPESLSADALTLFGQGGDGGAAPTGDPPAANDDAAAADDAPGAADEAADDLFADVEDREEPSAVAGDEGLSFEDLKTEFEHVADADPASLDEADGGRPEAAGASDGSPDATSAGASDDGGPADASAGPDIGDLETVGSVQEWTEEAPGEGGSPVAGSSKPYLTDLPGGYGAELVVMEWLDFLVRESSMAGAMRAIRYYRAVDWIAESVAGQLQSVLSGMVPEPERASPDGGRTVELTVDHHSRSLEYIAELSALAGERGPGAGGLAGLGLGREDRGVQR